MVQKFYKNIIDFLNFSWSVKSRKQIVEQSSMLFYIAGDVQKTEIKSSMRHFDW